MSVKGKVALIIGCRANAGAEHARQLAQAGAHVALHYGSIASQQESIITRGEIAQSGVRVTLNISDLSSEAAIERLVEYVFKAHGNIDIIVNTAGQMVREPFTRRSAVEQIKEFAYPVFVDQQRRVAATRYEQAIAAQQYRR